MVVPNVPVGHGGIYPVLFARSRLSGVIFVLCHRCQMSNPTMQDTPDDTQVPTLNVPKRTRWQKRNETRRPPGTDHSLGFPGRQNDTDLISNSTQSEVITFDIPLIFQEPGRSSVFTLEPIVEPHQSNSEGSNPQGSQTPVFGTPRQIPQSDFSADPWHDTEQPDINVASRTYMSRIPQFDYGAVLWQSIIDGQDPWAEEP